MLLLTTDNIPDNVTINEIFGLVEVTQAIELTQKNLLRRLTEDPENGHQKALDALSTAIRNAGGNLGYGIRHSTAIGQFSNGTYMYLTYTATAANADY